MNNSKKLVFAFFITAALMNNKCLLHNNVHASEIALNPQSSPYTSSENIFTKYGYKGQCTWFTYGRVLEKLQISLPTEFYGNAVDWWYANAKDKTYSYGSEPKANSIAVWGGGNYGYGHVAFVENVEGDNVYFTEGNFSIRGAYDGKVKTLSKEAIKARGNLYLKGYIYISQKNTNTPNTDKTNTNTTNNNTQTPSHNETVINKGLVNISSSSSLLNVRAGANSSSGVSGSLKKGENVNIVGKYGDWYKIEYNSSYGYVSSKYININGQNTTVAKTPTVSTPAAPTNNSPTAKSGIVSLSDKSSTLNLRNNPNGGVLTTLNQGTKVQILDSNGSWYKVNANGKIGYVLSAYINSSEVTKANSETIVASKTATSSQSKIGTITLSDESSTLNLRNTPWTGRIVSTLAYGSKVEILDTNGRWYKVKTGSQIGYVHSDYVKV